MEKKLYALGLLSILFLHAAAQDNYKYHVDLTNVSNDRLQVELITPKIKTPTVKFFFPKIVPGTYRNANYGRFITNVVAKDKSGNMLPVLRLDSNTWQIKSAQKLYSLSYLADDTWDDTGKGRDDIYSMAGTNIEAQKNFVINTPGFFGYFEGMRNNNFNLSFTKPTNFYGASPLTATSITDNEQVFQVHGIDEMYDSPIMFSAPDTASVKIGDATVQVASYAVKKQIRARQILNALTPLLRATAQYLGGTLPVKKYAFIYYFNSEQPARVSQGALEHNYSSFYALTEQPAQQLIPTLVDISSHEFFHIVTPLLLSSKEIKVFNFQEPTLSRHLWLYEGSTEYASDHVQVKYGLSTVNEYLKKLSDKINNSQRYNDTLAFTRLSLLSTTTYKEQFNNVYEKGALISACLDLLLLSKSNGTYGLAQLKHDLTWKFGKNSYFNDAELFDVIGSLTYPEVRTFFAKYVEQGNPIPYADYFALAGVRILPERNVNDYSFGGFQAVPDPVKIRIQSGSNFNAFGKQMGYQVGDELLSIQGTQLNPGNLAAVIAQVKRTIQPGEMLKVSVARKNANGNMDTVLLSAPIQPTIRKEKNILELAPNATEEQVVIRNAWLSTTDRPLPGVGNPTDVADINSIIQATYDVISGPAGEKNWERFRALFLPGAMMGANGPQGFRAFTFEDYIRGNRPVFLRSDFYETEINRNIMQYGNIATVHSSYQYKLSKDGKIEERGVNQISLVKSQGRWWISQLIWEDETPANPLPANLLKP